MVLTPLYSPMLAIAMMAGMGTPDIVQDNNGTEVSADAQDDGDAFDGIVVTANREGNYTVKPGDFREMLDAYFKWRGKYAPDGELFLQIRPAKGQEIGEVTAQLSRDDDIIDLVFDETRLVKLPAERLGDGKWELAFNQVKGKLRVIPTVFSPGTDQNNRRIGDLRMQCRLWWGFYNNRVNILFRGAFDMIGGCTTKRVGAYYPVEREIETAIIDGQSEPQPLLKPNNKGYLVPLSDKTISDDAMLRIIYVPIYDDAQAKSEAAEEAATDTAAQPTPDTPEY